MVLFFFRPLLGDFARLEKSNRDGNARVQFPDFYQLNNVDEILFTGREIVKYNTRYIARGIV